MKNELPPSIPLYKTSHLHRWLRRGAYILVQSRRRRLVSEQNELLSLLKESYTFDQCFLRFLWICFFQSSLSVLYSFSRSLFDFTLVLVTLLDKLRNRITLDPLYICWEAVALLARLRSEIHSETRVLIWDIRSLLLVAIVLETCASSMVAVKEGEERTKFNNTSWYGEADRRMTLTTKQ